MALPAVIDVLEDVDEAFRGEYREGTAEEKLEGKHVLDVTSHSSGYSLENVRTLKDSLGHVRDERDTAKATVESFGTYKPEDFKLLTTKLADSTQALKDGGQVSEAAIDSAVNELKTLHESELKDKDGENDRLTGVIDKLLIDSVATAAIVEKKGNPFLLKDHVRKQCRVEWVDGEPVARVMQPDNPKGNRVSLEQGSTAPMAIPELVGIMMKQDEYKPCFAGSGATGTGATGSGGGGSGHATNSEIAKMSPEEKMTYGRKQA